MSLSSLLRVTSTINNNNDNDENNDNDRPFKHISFELRQIFIDRSNLRKVKVLSISPKLWQKWSFSTCLFRDKLLCPYRHEDYLQSVHDQEVVDTKMGFFPVYDKVS